MKKKSKEFQHMSLEELQLIYVMRRKGLSIRQIAFHLERSPSVISNALTKHHHPNGRVWKRLSPIAQAEYVYSWRKRRAKASRKPKLEREPELLLYAMNKLINENLSPEQIQASVKKDFAGKKLTFKTLYNYVKKRRPDLVKYLHEKGKKRRQRVANRRGRFKQAAPIFRTIAERPSEVSIGDFEGDLVVSSRKGKGAVLSLRNRKTRKQTFIRIPDLKAHTVRNYLIIFFMAFPITLKITLTLDRGSEFAYSELIELEKIFPLLKIYYCDAYKPHQKGSVENGHRGFRWFFPKGTDFSMISQEEVTRIQDILNNKPMKVLGFISPSDMWQEEFKIAA